MNASLDNPFSVETPELMKAEDINDLFIPFGDTYKLERTNHVFMHGHRGCGKSMMLRRMSPDCQVLVNNCTFNELPFFGVYLSIKKTALDIIEFNLLESNASATVLSEHGLIIYIISHLFKSLSEESGINFSDEINKEIHGFLYDFIFERMKISGFQDIEELESARFEKGNDILNHGIEIIDRIHQNYIVYLKRKLSGLNNNLDYNGSLFGFHDFLLPILEKTRSLSFMPSGPIYILIDDADNLNLIHTKVLNTWVSYRTTDIVSFKVASQMKYKTYLALSGRRIEAPHDFSEFHISKIYTGSAKEKYPEWVSDVIRKRLESYKEKNRIDINTDPNLFFPEDDKQESEIKKIAEEIKLAWEEEKGKGYRANDDAYRYARPEYITRLGGSSKQSSNYKYAGLKQLVHISSGIIRHFLEPASKMYALERKNNDVQSISPGIQDKVIREESDHLLFSEFDRRIEDINNEVSDSDDVRQNNLRCMHKLRNLISTMGGLFGHLLRDERRSERKYFSFAISDLENLTGELSSVLKIGVEEGYFYESYIGNKEGSGRTKLYVLTRRLAPSFKLDPMGFSSYKFVTCKFLLEATNRPKATLSTLKSKNIDEVLEESQLSLDM